MAPLQVDLPDEAGWSAVSSGPLHVLVRAGGVVVDRVRAAAQDGDLDEVLDALTRDGVRATPDFVAVHEGEPTRVVARGGAYAVVSGPGGESTVRAAARGPWSDEDAAVGAERITLHTGSALAAAPAPPPAPPPGPSGWRAPEVFGRTKRQYGPPPLPTQHEAAPDNAPLPVGPHATTAPSVGEDEVEELPSYDHLFGATQHERPGYIEQHDTEGISEAPIGHAPIEAAGGFDPAAEARASADHTLAPPTHTMQPPARRGPDTARAGGPAGPEAPVSPPPDPPVQPTPAVPVVPGGLIDSVPWRSGGANVAPPDPAVPAAVAGARTPPPAPSLRPTPSVPPAPAAPAAPPAAPVPPAPAASVPSAPPRPLAPAAPPAPAPQPAAPAAPAVPAYPVDEAEATVDRSALLGGQAALDAGPQVLAVLCPAGHSSPPHSASCRLCGREIPTQQPFSTARPPLGLLRLQTGDVVQLDRGVLLGRSPKVNAELAAADRPHLVRVTSAQNDISRNHVEIVLEGWHVLIRDLDSTNGTTIALPGQLPVRLRPSDQQVLEPGTVITLADEVSLTYEVGA